MIPIKKFLAVGLCFLAASCAWGQRTISPISTSGSSSSGGAASNVVTGRILWVDSVNGSDSSGARGRLDKPFKTISRAKTNAAALDTVWVLPGRYTNETLFKQGVNYHFESGAVVTNYFSGTGAVPYLFNDNGTASTNVISGAGEFHFFSGGGQPWGMVVTSNANTQLHFKAAKMTAGNDGSLSAELAAFWVDDCRTMYIDVDEFEDNQWLNDSVESTAMFVYWEAGEMYVNCRRAITEANYVAWGINSGGTATNNLYYTGHYARSTVGPTFYLSDSSPLKMWINCLEIRADSSIAISSLATSYSGKMYVTAQKIYGIPPIDVRNKGQTWVTAQKITKIGVTPDPWVKAGGEARLYLDCLHYEQEGVMDVGFDLFGGTNYIRGGVATVTNLPLISAVGGRTVIDGLTARMMQGTGTNAAVYLALTNAANRLVLKNTTLHSGGATNSIYAANAQNVMVIGTVQTTNANPNVTFQGSIITSGAFAESQ